MNGKSSVPNARSDFPIPLSVAMALRNDDLRRNELWLSRPGNAEQLVEIPAAQRGGWRVEADFIDSIRDGKPVTLTDFATGVKYMHFTEAVWESWNAVGQRVTL